jgi:rhodanese-related sulfurtransferase
MNLINREELREKIDRGDEFKLVMTLSAFAHRSKRIPTSLHFETVGDALAALDPADDIVVYCGDAHCAASIYAYRLLEREGYTRVRRYAGGIADWEEAGYPLAAGPDEPPPARMRERTRSRKRVARPWLVCA